MIYEYAVEPGVVINWSERDQYRYYRDKFGLGTSRVIARFPNRWERMIWDTANNIDQNQRKRLEVLLMDLQEKVVRRESPYDPSIPWLNNSLKEHTKHPFKAILALTRLEGCEFVLTDENIGEVKNPLWDSSYTANPPRNAEKLIEIAGPLLTISTTAIFIDPYFNPNKPSCLTTLKGFLERLFVHLRPIRIEVHVSADNDNAPAEEFFRRTCIQKIAPLIPPGGKVKFCRFKQRTGQDRLHNRFILTNMGGLMFGIGLDEGKEGEIEDVVLMSKEQYLLRWAQYAGANPEFELESNPFDVISNQA